MIGKQIMNKSTKAITLLILTIFLLVSTDLLAKKKSGSDRYLKKKITAKKRSKAKKKKEEEKKEPKKEEIILWTVGLGGGYYMPMGFMGGELKPNWAAKLYFEKINEDKTAGFASEFIYSGLKDLETAGGITYYTAMTRFFINIETSYFDLQFGGGPGLSFLYAEIDNGLSIEKSYSVDFTVYGIVGIQKNFLKNYFVAADVSVYYYFEKNSSYSTMFFLKSGYRF